MQQGDDVVRRNRVTRLELVKASELLPNPKNWRTHGDEQRAVLSALLDEVGIVDAVIARETADGLQLVDGHLRQSISGDDVVPVLVVDLDDSEADKVLATFDPVAAMAATDKAKLTELLAGVETQHEALVSMLAKMTIDAKPPRERNRHPTPAEVPERVTPGDVWQLGQHRLVCGDSTDGNTVANVMRGDVADTIHADPPYGMGKQIDGVAGDNVYREQLDKFQMSWWVKCRPHLSNTGSAYIWGNAADLWRLWYVGGLAQSELLTLENEIVWDKHDIAGMKSAEMTQYPTASERCLFFKVGAQDFDNINVADFPEQWEPLRAYLADEAAAAGVTAADVHRVCGVQMFSHWFTRSQFAFIGQQHYAKLAAAYPGRFERDWEKLNAEWLKVKQIGRDLIAARLAEMRAYFDNAHDIMTDVWNFPRVVGAERYGHATPKPVELISRAIKTSTPLGGVVLEPFIGTGSTIIAAEETGRRCCGIELLPHYCDVAVERWQRFTGLTAVKL